MLLPPPAVAVCDGDDDVDAVVVCVYCDEGIVWSMWTTTSTTMVASFCNACSYCWRRHDSGLPSQLW